MRGKSTKLVFQDNLSQENPKENAVGPAETTNVRIAGKPGALACPLNQLK